MKKFEDYIEKREKVAIVGLGYVGLPIALAFAKKISVIGFDINEKKVDLLKQNIDPSKELESKEFENADIVFTNNKEDIKDASFYVVTVPTPIDDHKNPDLGPLESATEIVGDLLDPGDCVVFESTVYPACTEEFCVPILEKRSGMKYIKDFKVGYSPERINPGDKEHTFTRITKVVSGCDEESLGLISEIYGHFIEAGTFKAASIKVAEAAKIIENTQRDLNISLMNELSLIFDKLGINTYDVIEAAATKWNFLKFYPGLVGGHCIGVDPYYLTHKATALGFYPKVILAGRQTNDSMGSNIARKLLMEFSRQGKTLKNSKVLILGATFKENVTDIRNSKVVDVVNELYSYSVNVDIFDVNASKEEYALEYNIELTDKPGTDYDAIIVAVPHKEFLSYDEKYFKSISKQGAILYDIKGILKGKIKEMTYWSL